MRIYMSGKITGLPRREASWYFGEAHRKLVLKGHEVISPMAVGVCLPGLDWKAYMTIAHGIIHDPSVDAIFMLKNWTESAGAIVEWGWAQARGLPILYEDPAHYRKYGRRTSGWFTQNASCRKTIKAEGRQRRQNSTTSTENRRSIA